MYFHTALGDVLREARIKQKRTLRDVAKKSSMALGYLSEVERGQKQASSDVIENLAKVLYYTPSELILEVGFRMAQYDIPDTAESLMEIEKPRIPHFG